MNKEIEKLASKLPDQLTLAQYIYDLGYDHYRKELQLENFTNPYPALLELFSIGQHDRIIQNNQSRVAEAKKYFLEDDNQLYVDLCELLDNSDELILKGRDYQRLDTSFHPYEAHAWIYLNPSSHTSENALLGYHILCIFSIDYLTKIGDELLGSKSSNHSDPYKAFFCFAVTGDKEKQNQAKEKMRDWWDQYAHKCPVLKYLDTFKKNQ